jgi:hypothetical protein
MWSPDELDVVRDSLALVEACHRGDLEAARVLLDNARLRPVAAFLARIVTDLVEDWADDPAGAFAALREHHTAGLPSQIPGEGGSHGGPVVDADEPSAAVQVSRPPAHGSAFDPVRAEQLRPGEANDLALLGMYTSSTSAGC